MNRFNLNGYQNRKQIKRNTLSQNNVVESKEIESKIISENVIFDISKEMRRAFPSDLQTQYFHSMRVSDIIA